MSHKSRIAHLERRFSERAGARRLDEIFAAVQTGDIATLEMQERLETAAGGRHGWTANLFMSIQRALADAPMIAPEDMERPEA